MYNPKYSQVEDIKTQLDFIRRYPLGTLITIADNSLQTSYLPFLVEQKGDELYLLTHLARANPQWKDILEKKSLISFRGPDCYISPTLYKTSPQVPTWNYTAVECSGEAELIDDVEGLDALMKASVDYFEKRNDTNWRYELPENFKIGLLKAIVGVRFKITQIDAKFKLSQNRGSEDYAAVKEFLQTSKAPFASEMLYWFSK